MGEVGAFFFRGRLPASKSILNRCLICASYSDRLRLRGDSKCEDVRKMRDGIRNLLRGEEADCASAGTVLRFLAFRASRLREHRTLCGTQRLFSRPQRPLVSTLAELGVRAEFSEGKFFVESGGWMDPGRPLEVDCSRSSQFASGLLLNSWELPFPLSITLVGAATSEGYWRMTLRVVRDLGMSVETDGNVLRIPAGQRVTRENYFVEPDLSSAFAVAAVASLRGEAVFEDFPSESLQPDRAFVEILAEMGALVEKSAGRLVVKKAPGLKPIERSLADCPDLFPILAVLCALAPGRSRLHDAPRLVFKESNRIKKTAELIRKMGRSCDIESGGLRIDGRRGPWPEPFLFDTDQDHRLAFAAAVAAQAGCPVRLTRPEAVNKSFPEFWEIVGRK